MTSTSVPTPKLSRKRRAVGIVLIIIAVFFLLPSAVGLEQGQYVVAVAAIIIFSVLPFVGALYVFGSLRGKLTQRTVVKSTIQQGSAADAGAASTLSQDQSPFTEISKLESLLRDCIEQELSKVSPNWWKDLVPADVILAVEQRMTKGQNLPSWVKGSSRPIDYVDFGDYVKIISKNWNQVFKPIFKDKEFVSLRLRELIPLRNNVMHGRALSYSETEKVNLFTHEIKQCIPHYKPLKVQISNRLEALGSLLRYQTLFSVTQDAFEYDVVWKKLKESAPLCVFEIMGTGQGSISLAKLKHANDLWNSSLCLILPKEELTEINRLLNGSFHEIASSLILVTLDEAQDSVILERKLGQSLATR